MNEWMDVMPVRMDWIRDHRGVSVRITRDAFAGEPLRFHCKCGWRFEPGTTEDYGKSSQTWRSHVDTDCKARVTR